MATRRTFLMAGMVGVGSWVLGYAAELGRGPGKPVHLMVELPALDMSADCVHGFERFKALGRMA
jgi:hypothetical protein